jgi:cystathionine beta-lyase/cystathionine gamma-synthase
VSKAEDGARPNWHFDTRSARAGKGAQPSCGVPTNTPIVASSGFEQADSDAIDEVFDGAPGYVYGRYHNPTVEALEHAVADLEGAEAALAYSAGMAAIAGAFEALELKRGAKIVAARDLYGSTITWLEGEAQRRGWEIVYTDAAPGTFSAEVLDGAGAMYCETLSNPLVRVFDLGTVGSACAAAGVPLLVDATFTPPCLLRPLEHQATLVAHSATKYLGGHGDVIAGVLSGASDLIDRARARRTLDGTIADPFTAWLVLRGIKTLSLRVERQCANAARVAARLQASDAVGTVHYPGLAPRDTVEEQATLERLYPHGRYGAMLAFEIAAGGDAVARRFVDALRLWGRATTLGDLDSLALIPAMTSHRKLGEARRAELGIVPGLVRLSVGIENVDDLIADLDAALAAGLLGVVG